jgi:RNA polymerase sigma-70 factor (ECF subfamily)
MLLHDWRRAARVDAGGNLVLLEHQDPSLWRRGQMEEGLALAAYAINAAVEYGLYALQAAIAAEHARARRSTDTDWSAIAAHYDAASPVSAETNRCQRPFLLREKL